MSDEPPAMLRAESGAGAAVQSLRAQLQHWAAKRPPSARGGSGESSHVISSGCQALDQLLPQAGFPDGSLVECLGDSLHAGGAGMLRWSWPGTLRWLAERWWWWILGSGFIRRRQRFWAWI